MYKLAALLIVAAPLSLSAQQASLNVTPGYWEKTSVVHTPQGTTGGSVTHACVAQSDLSHPERLVDSPYCTTKVTSMTSSSADLSISCTNGGNETTNGTLHLTVNSTTSVTGKAQLQFNYNGTVLPVTGDYTAKWLSAKCGATP